MNTKIKIVFGAFLVLLLGLTYLEATEPQPVNWNPSYMDSDKIALGSAVFFNSWKENKGSKIEKISIPPFEFLDAKHKGVYFFLNNQIHFDDAELSKLLNWVSKGNTVFLSAGNIGKNLLDTLNLETSVKLPGENFNSSPYLKLVNPSLKQDSLFHYKHETKMIYFSKIDTLKSKVLGTSSLDSVAGKNEEINFIKVDFGKGEILLHTMPEAFSNYFMLTNTNYRYVQGVLAYLNASPIIFWDSYYKAGKSFYASPLYVLLNNNSLKWAYYFLIIGAVLFIIFEGKRKQRAIAVVHPLKNQNYEYSKTVSSLYLEKKEYKELALKKRDQFFEYIRRVYRIDTFINTEDYREQLSEKSGNTRAQTKAIFQKITELEYQEQVSKNEFLHFAKAIQSYKNNTYGH